MSGGTGGGPRAEEQPASWSEGAAAYDAEFAGFTGAYADELLDVAGVGPGSRFLDVAAGTGALAVPAARRGAVVTATDFAPGMVAVLRRRLAALDGARAACAVTDGSALAVAPRSHDAAGSAFGLMFLPDVAAGVAQAATTVRPGGPVALLTWHLDGFPLHRLTRGALEAVSVDPLPPSPPPVWAPVGRAGGLAAALAEGGLESVEVRVVTREWRWEDPVAFFRGMSAWSVPLRPVLAAAPAGVVDAAAEAFAGLVAQEAGPSGGVPVEALLGVGRVG